MGELVRLSARGKVVERGGKAPEGRKLSGRIEGPNGPLDVFEGEWDPSPVLDRDVDGDGHDDAIVAVAPVAHARGHFSMIHGSLRDVPWGVMKRLGGPLAFLLVVAPACGDGSPTNADETSTGPGPGSTSGSVDDGSTATAAPPSTTSTEPESSSGDPPSTDSTDDASTGSPIEITPRVVWYITAAHGAEGAWPVPRDDQGEPMLLESTVYAPLDAIEAPMVFVEGVDNAVLPGDGPGVPNSRAMARLLTASAIVDDLAAGPSIDQVLASAQVRAPGEATYFAGVARAAQQPAVYAQASVPLAPLADPLDAWQTYAAPQPDLEGFPAIPPLDFDGANDEQLPVVLAFHQQMAAEVLRRHLTAHAVLQLGHTEGVWSVPWLGAGCTVQLLYHDQPGCPADVTWADALTWTTTSVVDLVDAFAGKTMEDGSSLLDHTLIVWMQDYGTASSHSLEDLPVVLIGGAALGRSGRTFVDAEGFDQADLAMSIAALVGVDLETFGDPIHAAEPIPGL